MAARTPRAIIVRLTDAERDAHRAFVATLGADALWRAYLGGTN
jgi:DNA polymerase-3 subunit epsilon